MPTATISKALDHEVLSSEKLKAKLLAWVFVFASVALFLLRFFFSDYLSKTFSDITVTYYLQGILFLFVIRELVVIAIIKNRLDTGKTIGDKYRYISSFFEISYPTIVLLVMYYFTDSTIILFTPIIYFYFLVIILSTLSLDYRISIFIGAVAAIEYFSIFLLLEHSIEGLELTNLVTNNVLHFNIAVVLVIGGLLAGFVANQMKVRIVNINHVLVERNKIMNMFGQQVSSSIVDELINTDNKVETKERQVCVLFLDIRGFTQFAENKKPDEIIGYQNKVFGFMIEIIIKHNGIINQFLGDGYMATFGLPISRGNDTQNAVNAAHEIIDKLKAKNDLQEIPLTRIGIGLHSGLVVAGNVGTDERKQYSISGNTVILASRIEQLTKTYKAQLLISKEVLDEIDPRSIEPSLIGDVLVKGREMPIELWQLR